jgi:hypothetical protein
MTFQTQAELHLDHTLRTGDHGPAVRRVQEWLCLQGQSTTIDGDFGEATRQALGRFQEGRDLPPTGEADPTTYEDLVDPLASVLGAYPVPPADRDLGNLTCLRALIHLDRRPREIGGENRGPWVRLYMGGREGRPWKWCAGFACFILQQACRDIGVTPPVQPSFSCSELAARAKRAGCFLSEASVARDRSLLAPGSLFLCRKRTGGYEHTGIVLEVHDAAMDTAEGNTTDGGVPNGYEAIRRVRGYPGRDFILVR